jgi:hypothetical protein
MNALPCSTTWALMVSKSAGCFYALSGVQIRYQIGRKPRRNVREQLTF